MTDDRENTGEALRRDLELLESVLDYAPGFIMAIDEHGKLRYINRVLPQHDKKRVVGTDWTLYLPPDQQDSLRVCLQNVLETGASKTFETNVTGPQGERVWLTTHMGPMRSGGRVVGAVIVSQEITELRRTQLEFAAAQRMAAVGTLAAGIAHEINTPVQFVGDSIQFLREGTHDTLALVDTLQRVCRLVAQEGPSAAVREALAAVDAAEAEAGLSYLRENLPQALDRCADGLRRVANIVSSIREFAHPPGEEMAPVDLNRSIANTLVLVRSEYAHVAELVTVFDALPRVTCHVDQINQVVLNLVINAAHAIADVFAVRGVKGRLVVRTRAAGDDVVISVSDTGAGVPEAIRERIFEPFFTTKEVGRGTGLGLALAWTLVTEKHGGTLWFETVPGEGTTFFARLPTAGMAASRVPLNPTSEATT